MHRHMIAIANVGLPIGEKSKQKYTDNITLKTLFASEYLKLAACLWGTTICLCSISPWLIWFVSGKEV